MRIIIFSILIVSTPLMAKIVTGGGRAVSSISSHDPVSDEISRCIKEGDAKSLKAITLPKDYGIGSNLIGWIGEIVNKKKDKELLSVLLDQVSTRVDLKQYCSNYNRDLWYALLHNGNEWAIKHFIKNYDLDPNQWWSLNRGYSPSCPLKRASRHLNVSLLKVLLDNGAEPDAEVLDEAVTYQNLGVVKLILSYGANPDEHLGSYWITPLTNAEAKVDIVCSLSSDYYYKDNNNPYEKRCRIAMQIVSELEKHERVSQLIIKKVAKVINSMP